MRFLYSPLEMVVLAPHGASDIYGQLSGTGADTMRAPRNVLHVSPFPRWRRCGLRQRGERHTLSRRRFGREALAACRHQKVKSSQVKSVLACTAAVRSVAPRAPRAGNSGARGSRCRCRGRRRRGREGGPSSRCRLRRSRAPQWHLRGEQAAVSARRPGPDGRWVRAVAAAAHLPTRRESSRSPAAH